ncbi:hypothetical protein HY745_03610 [Candidatus Desantisbacteria bacterium]|nr:hypothetical protein [Candidatus Desantisbacteria bacterium]
MKKIFFLPVILMFVIASFLFSCGPDLKKYEYLKTPQIRNIPKQKMITVHVQGDPNAAGGKAFKTLFKMFYKLKGKNKEVESSAPRARWPKSLSTPKNEWIGIYGLPIPESVKFLQEEDSSPLIRAI